MAAHTETLTLMAPLTGILVPLERVPDEAFAQRLAGDGVSIDPLSDRVLAPCDARVVQVHRAHHALTLSAAGLEIIIHVGLDTVALKGAGFTPLVQAGDDVRMGDALLAFDADLVARRARSLLTQLLITNVDRIAALQVRSGRVVAARDVIMQIAIKRAMEPATAAAPGESGAAVVSRPVIVTTEMGLHARPAAMLAAAARRFAADLRLVKDGQEANIRSIVSIMALEVGGGEAVTIVGRGHDAGEAVAALVKTLSVDLAGTQASPPPRPPAGSQSAERASAPASHGAIASIALSAPSATLRGVAASPGIAVGQIFRIRNDDFVVEERAADAAHERRVLNAAIKEAQGQLETLRAQLVSGAADDQAAIFAAHQELLEDPDMLGRAQRGIGAGATAAYAWREAYMAQADRLVALRNPLLAARAADLRDVGRRVLHLVVGRETTLHALPSDAIVVAEELTPSDAASLDRAKVRGLCTTRGSATSHVAILARGWGLPAVVAIDPRVLDLAPGTRVVLDGDAGTLCPSPTEADEADVVRRQDAGSRRRRSDLAAAGEPAITRDGHRIEVVANIGSVAEAALVPDAGGEGVGLLRTEFLFMDRPTAPDEEEQASSYEAIARTLGPDRILVIRTLDVGGDKPLPYLPTGAEANPFLGERGIRLTLNRPELFRAQVRAILRASPVGRIAIMFPMVSTITEWRAAREIVERERAALGVPRIQIGIMIETPAAALLADRLAHDADFFSIGTNDLAQYTLAMDRGNARLAPQVDALHPAVLRLIERTVAGARAHGRWVGVCGALAGDLRAVPVLLGLGIDELSADVPAVPGVKARVRGLSLEECRATARVALEADGAEDVRALVDARHGLG